jgi:pimeloyl-ACP methyl ester carboxylesterase
MGLDRPLVGGYSDGGQVALELGARHPDAASALIIGAAYPDFATTGLRDVMEAMVGVDEQGNPDLAQVDATLGDFADLLKSLHPGREEQWPRARDAERADVDRVRRTVSRRGSQHPSACPCVHRRSRRVHRPRSLVLRSSAHCRTPNWPSFRPPTTSVQ